MTQIVIVTKTGERLGIVETDAPCYVGPVMGPIIRDSAKGAAPLDEQPAHLTVGGMMVTEVLKLQGKNVVIFELREEGT